MAPPVIFPVAVPCWPTLIHLKTTNKMLTQPANPPNYVWWLIVWLYQSLDSQLILIFIGSLWIHTRFDCYHTPQLLLPHPLPKVHAVQVLVQMELVLLKTTSWCGRPLGYCTGVRAEPRSRQVGIRQVGWWHGGGGRAVIWGVVDVDPGPAFGGFISLLAEVH